MRFEDRTKKFIFFAKKPIKRPVIIRFQIPNYSFVHDRASKAAMCEKNKKVFINRAKSQTKVKNGELANYGTAMNR